jgi:hypothetical protein
VAVEDMRRRAAGIRPADHSAAVREVPDPMAAGCAALDLLAAVREALRLLAARDMRRGRAIRVMRLRERLLLRHDLRTTRRTLRRLRGRILLPRRAAIHFRQRGPGLVPRGQLTTRMEESRRTRTLSGMAAEG